MNWKDNFSTQAMFDSIGERIKFSIFLVYDIALAADSCSSSFVKSIN